MYASSSFIDDGLFALVTFGPLIYLFNADVILLVGAVHLLSIAFAGVAHADTLGSVQSFVLLQSILLVTLADVVLLCFCLCQLSLSTQSCDALSAVGITCHSLTSVPLGVLLVPLVIYNLTHDVGRFWKVWAATVTADFQGLSLALTALIFFKSANAALLLMKASTKVVEVQLLLIIVVYGFLPCLATVANWKRYSKGSTQLCFVCDALVFTLHGATSVAGKTPVFGFFIAVVVFITSTTILVGKKRERSAWGVWFLVVWFATATAVTFHWWESFTTWSALAFFAYTTTPAAKMWLTFGSETQNYSGFVATIIFLVIDLGALVVSAATYVSVDENDWSVHAALPRETYSWVPVIAATFSSIMSCVQINRKHAYVRQRRILNHKSNL
jgi:hypothetical protein